MAEGVNMPPRVLSWDTSAIRLAGIEHGTVGNKAIKGALAFRLIDAIKRNHPDLAPAITLVRRQREDIDLSHSEGMRK